MPSLLIQADSLPSLTKCGSAEHWCVAHIEQISRDNVNTETSMKWREKACMFMQIISLFCRGDGSSVFVLLLIVSLCHVSLWTGGASGEERDPLYPMTVGDLCAESVEHWLHDREQGVDGSLGSHHVPCQRFRTAWLSIMGHCTDTLFLHSGPFPAICIHFSDELKFFLYSTNHYLLLYWECLPGDGGKIWRGQGTVTKTVLSS